MKKIIKLITAILVSIFSTTNYAASTPNGDAVSQAYAMSQTLKTQEKIPGISLFGGQIIHNQPVIKGNLPYVMSYVGSVRNSLSASNDYFDQYLTTGGWTDNYQNSVRFYQTGAANIGIYAIRLPGSRQDIWLRNDRRSTCNGGVLRAFSSDILGKIAYDNGANLVWACSTNGYELRENTGGGVTLTYRSTAYTTTPTSVSQSGTAYYRIATAQNFQTTRILKFNYDASLNMLSVEDNFNNKLEFSRNYKSGITQTAAETRLISHVELTSGMGTKQNASFSYASYNSQDANGKSGSIYYPTAVNSTAFGNNSFGYTAIKQWGIEGYLNFQKIRPINTNAATLTSVKDATNRVVREWLVTQNYATYNSNTKTYGTAQVTLQVRTPNGSSGYVSDYTINYDDNARTVSLRTRPNGQNEGTVTYTITPKPVYKKSIDDTNYYDDGESEIRVSGSFPALTINGNVPKNITMHSWYDYISSVVTVNDLMISQQLDTSGRLTKVSYAGPSITQNTIEYIYGDFPALVAPSDTSYFLFGPRPNTSLTPQIIKAGNVTITNKLTYLNAQIMEQVVSSTQTGSVKKITSYNYNIQGKLLSVDGPYSGTTDKIYYTYDDFGNLKSQSQTINGAVRTTSYEGYNNFALPERIVHPNGLVEQFTYNADGTINTKTLGEGGSTGSISGQTTTYTYNDLKQLIAEINPDDEVSSYQYNSVGQQAQIILSNGNRIAYTYFPNGIVSSEVQTTSNNAIASQSYTLLDENGRISKQYSGNNANQLYTTFTYDNNGNLVQTGTAQGITEKWTYDALNRVRTHTDGMGNVDIKNYDINDNIILAKDAVNAGSNPLTYRNGNVLTQEVNSDFGTKSYSYNGADFLTQKIHSARKCNYNNIDVIGRYRAFVCTAMEGSTPNEYRINDSYTYDQSRFGRLDKVTSNIAGLDINTNYTYDAFDRITQKSQTNLLANRWLNTANQSLNVGYGYSTVGKLTSLTLPSGREVGYNYNIAAGTLTGISLNNSALIRNISYDGANRITGWSWGASGTASYSLTYASSGLLNSIINRNNNTIDYSLAYSYDADGRIVAITRNNGLRDGFTYDATDRLTNENRTNGSTTIYSINYSYDKNGNRIGLSATGNHEQPAANATYTYTGNKLSAFNKDGVSQTITYTANADMAFGPYSAAYDNGGRRKADHGSNHYYYMNYNHKNERNTRGYMSNNTPSNVTQYVYDEESHLIGEYSGATPIVEYVWMGDKPVAAIYGSGTATKIYYIIPDHANTPRRLIDSSNQTIVWSWDSTAFGVGTPVASVTFNLRFPGQYYDVGTGQFYNHNRFYNPELGRYLEPDPIGLEGGLNPYSYCYQNPIMFVDPNGKVPIPIITGAIGGIAGGLASAGSQLFINKGVEGFNWKSVGVAVAVGAAAGAVSPWTATSTIGAAVTGSVASTAQYGSTQYVNNEPTTLTGYAVSASLGAIGGFTAGALPKPNYVVKPSTFISAQEATRTNNNIMWNMATTNKSLAYNLGGAAIAADPMSLGSFNMQVANNQLYTSQYKNYQIGNPSNTNPMDWTSIRGTFYLEPIRW